MTRGELRDVISFEARLKDPDLYTTYINEAINRVYFDLVKELRLPEFLVRKSIISLTGMGSGDLVILNVNFLFEDRVRFFDATTTSAHRLVTEKDHVPPAPIFGLPKVYKIVNFNETTNGITIEPKTLMDEVNDKLWLDYYKKPNRLDLDTDAPASRKLDEEIIKRCSHILLSIEGKVQEGQQVLSHTMKQPGAPAAVLVEPRAENK